MDMKQKTAGKKRLIIGIIVGLCVLLAAVMGGLFLLGRLYSYELKVKTVADWAEAEALGYSLETLPEHGFVIRKQGDTLYVLGRSEEDTGRGLAYLEKNSLRESYVDYGTQLKRVYIGQHSIEEYKISYSDFGAKEACQELQYYIRQGCNYIPPIVFGKKTEGLFIDLNLVRGLPKGQSDFCIQEGTVLISAGDKETLKEAAYCFLNSYLGWKDAGTDRACVSTLAEEINVPENVNAKSPWMEEREAIVCLWNTNNPRGVYLNEDSSLKVNLLDYTESQLYEYVKMLKHCGFTGVQVTDMCSAWAGADSYPAVHEKIRVMADAAHSMDMKFTLWVWGAEFDNYGWSDRSVTFSQGEYEYQHQNPEVVACFEKYYSIYAQLADVCDRVIGHYYDPGNLYTTESVAFFAGMLRDKFTAINPEIDFGVSLWVDKFDKSILVAELGNDITLYEGGYREDESEYVSFRNEVAALGCRLGTWAWNTCEMEIDQLAQMNFRMDYIKGLYQTARKYDGIIKPDYWSEMDSYHVLNVFSLYCAGQLLIDPDMPEEELYRQVATAVVGPEYAGRFAETLELIQLARTGEDWRTQSAWNSDNYILKSESYPAGLILERSEQSLELLDQMIEAEIESYELPLPLPLKEVLRLMQPHIRQIHDFAEFRIAFDALKAEAQACLPKCDNRVAEAESGAATEAISDESTRAATEATTDENTRAAILGRLESISEPIKPYNCIIGIWGQIEARAQYEMISEFCREYGLEIPQNATFRHLRKRYIHSQIITFQKTTPEKPYVVYSPYYQWGVAYGVEETELLVQELVDEGLLLRSEDGGVYLADWENYEYHFD